MTPEEQLNFCGHLMMAARKLRIFAHMGPDGFWWFDSVTSRRWQVNTVGATDKKQIVQFACTSLVHYLSCQKT